LTRWMVSHGWSTYVQCCKEAELLSTMKPNWRFLKQVLRWTRNTWRSDLRSLFMERHVWTTHPYVAYTMASSILARDIISINLCVFLSTGRQALQPVHAPGRTLPGRLSCLEKYYSRCGWWVPSTLVEHYTLLRRLAYGNPYR
jgi:hypothetical protein